MTYHKNNKFHYIKIQLILLKILYLNMKMKYIQLIQLKIQLEQKKKFYTIQIYKENF